MASYSKPGVLARFRKGVLISVIEGVVATLNWLVSFADNFSVSTGLSISGQSTGRPKISLNLTAGDNIKIDKEGDALKISLDGEIESGGIKVTGTDGGSVDGVKELRISAGEDTNLEAKVAADTSDPSKATLTINVYYL